MTGEIEPIKIYDGISVELIKKEGTEAQKEAVALYDEDNNGKLEGYEAEDFSNVTCELEKSQDGFRKLKLTMEREDGINQVTEFTYKESKDLERCLIDGNYFTVFRTKASKFYASIAGIFKKATFDLVNNKVALYGAGDNSSLSADNADVKVANSDMEYIIMEGGKLDLKNTKNYRKYFPDGPTSVQTDGKTIITADDNSEYTVDILEQEE